MGRTTPRGPISSELQDQSCQCKNGAVPSFVRISALDPQDETGSIKSIGTQLTEIRVNQQARFLHGDPTTPVATGALLVCECITGPRPRQGFAVVACPGRTDVGCHPKPPRKPAAKHTAYRSCFSAKAPRCCHCPTFDRIAVIAVRTPVLRVGSMAGAKCGEWLPETCP
jgi:hypothetical protein